jgi:Xaa-Pro aminopeptidase
MIPARVLPSLVMRATNPSITVTEYAERRAKVLDALNGAAAVVLAGDQPASEVPWGRRPVDSYFWYLTGIDTEPGAAVLFDPSAEDPERRIALLLRSRDPEVERWDGARAPLDAAYKSKTGFSDLARTGSLASRLTEAARRTRRLACLHPFASYDCDLSPDLVLFKKVCERVPTAALEDRTQLLLALRAVKSPAELALIERAIAMTATGFQAAFQAVHPGADEGAVADAMTEAFRASGGGPAFDPIVGSGVNGTVLHYGANDKPIADGDLVVIDYAAAVEGYASDVTRTLPANGKFSAEQRKLYEIVLEANLAATAAARPGATYTQVHNAARDVIAKAGYQDYFPHGVGHHLGLDVHDPAPDGPLATGMVLTIEPGIYLPQKGMGVRIEDDVLITQSSPRVLTEAIPKTVEAVEAAMRSGKS